MNTNSLSAYFNCVLPHLNTKQCIVLRAIIELRAATDEQIGDYLHLADKHISGRVGELKKLGLIKCEKGGRTKAGNECRISVPNDEYKMVSIGEAISHLRPEVQERIFKQKIQPSLLA